MAENNFVCARLLESALAGVWLFIIWHRVDEHAVAAFKNKD
jgi:hypothetical protein